VSLRVLMVLAAPFPFPQGGQVLVAGQARGLGLAGCEVSLAAYPDGQGTWPEGVRRVPVASSLRAPRRSGPSWRKGRLDLDLLRAVVRVLRRDPPDVVLAHHVEGLTLAWAARRMAGTSTPIAWVPHTLLGEELATYRPPALDGRVGAWLDGMADRVGAWVDGRLPPMADLVLPLSSRGAAQAEAAGARAVVVVPPGVDPDELAGGDGPGFRRRLGVRPDTPLVLYTGNADRYQDVPDLVRAASYLPPEARIVLVTHGPAAAMRHRVAEGQGDDRARHHVLRAQRRGASRWVRLDEGEAGERDANVCDRRREDVADDFGDEHGGHQRQQRARIV